MKPSKYVLDSAKRTKTIDDITVNNVYGATSMICTMRSRGHYTWVLNYVSKELICWNTVKLHTAITTVREFYPEWKYTIRIAKIAYENEFVRLHLDFKLDED